MFMDATEFGIKLCNWKIMNDEDIFEMFDGSNCDFLRCFLCTYTPTSSPLFTLLHNFIPRVFISS